MSDVVKLGDDVQIKVVNVDVENNRWLATMVLDEEQAAAGGRGRYRGGDEDATGERGPAPRQARFNKQNKKREGGAEDPSLPPVSVNQTFSGTVESLTPYGAFINLGNGRKGLMHMSQMKLPEGKEEVDFASVFKAGDTIDVRVMAVKPRKIDLTMKSEAEVKAEIQLNKVGVSAVADIPEGAGAMAALMARAGVNKEMFAGAAAAAPKKAAAPAPAAEEELKEESLNEKAPAANKAIATGAVDKEEETKPKEAAVAAKKEETAPATGGGGAISAQLVKQLREESGAGMMDCKKALAENDGDLDKAREFLRKKGLASADKKAGRVAAEGAIWSYIHAGSRLGVLVEVNCETDFVARGDVFKELVNDISMQIAACSEVSVVSVDEVSSEELDRERAIELQKEDILTKPEAIRGKIVEGRIEKIAKARALLEQPYVKDTSKTVEQLVKEAVASIGENIQIRRFAKFNLGEGIELEDKGDFAAEVEAQTASMQAKAAEKKEEEMKEEEAPAAAEKKPAVAVSAAIVKELREKTGAGMMDCKKALAENDGDVEKATEFLRKKGLASADKKAGRVAAEGAVGAYIHAGNRLGVVVEVNCETDFVARGDVFRELVNDMAMQIAACPEVKYVSTSDVPAEMLERERAIEMQKEDLASKPEAIRGKIVDGRIEKIAKEMSLLEQQFIKDTSKTVAEHIKEQIATIGENIQVRRFNKFVLGEGVEKKEVDFAAEVAAQTGGMV